jgi:hypothetical protein
VLDADSCASGGGNCGGNCPEACGGVAVAGEDGDATETNGEGGGVEVGAAAGVAKLAGGEERLSFERGKRVGNADGWWRPGRSRPAIDRRWLAKLQNTLEPTLPIYQRG